jgi:hypothetical protein
VAGSFRRPAIWVFGIVFGSYAFFWHTRDWNTASRLMLSYALVDRGTVSIDGLERQTGDKAEFRGHYYSDKLPGFSLLAAIPYAFARWIGQLPPHPLNRAAFPYWPPDYWVTLSTSGFLTACTSALIVYWAGELGCSRRRAALVGLAYGLATPAYVYATLAYGHQSSAFALFASFYLLSRRGRRADSIGALSAGFLAAFAAVIELQVGPVAAILGLYLVVECARDALEQFRESEPPGKPVSAAARLEPRPGGIWQSHSCRRRVDALAYFLVGAIIPTVLLGFYNQLAFGSPWDFGYFHHATREFAQVHNPNNPLGLTGPDWTKLVPLLFSRHRGLFFYAPILLLSLPGWVMLVARRRYAVAAVSLAVAAAILLVNLSYPEWTGGWSTGPRLLIPLLPFAMLPAAAILAGESTPARIATAIAVSLFLAGAILMLLFQGVGARVPHVFDDPLVQTVWPIWKGGVPLFPWRMNERFCANGVSLIAGPAISKLAPGWQWVQFLPLVFCQAVAIIAAFAFAIPGHGSDLVVDQEQQAGRGNQQAEDPDAQAHGVKPDSRPGFVTSRRIDDADRDNQRKDKPVDIGRSLDHAEPSALSPPAARALEGEPPSTSSSDSMNAGPS